MAGNVFSKGFPLNVVWNLSKPDGTSFSLEGYQYRLFYSVGGRQSEASDSSFSDNIISWVLTPDKQMFAGDYSMKLVLFQNGKHFLTLKYNNAFSLYNIGVESPNLETQDEEMAVVHLYSVAEFYLLKPVVPTVGNDGFWWVNGERLVDGNGENVAADHTVEYDSETNYIIIDRGRVDAHGQSIEQTITSLADFLSDAGNAEDDRLEAEGQGDYSDPDEYPNTRRAKEADRQEAEAERIKKEGSGGPDSEGYSTSRIKKEIDRQNAETLRQSNEETRQQQEGSPSDEASASGSRWARYKHAEAARQTVYNEAEAERNAAMAPLAGYYACSTADSTAAKEVAATNYVLTNGGSIKVKFTYANSASSPTLNINSTGAKAIVYNGAPASASNTWAAGDVVEFYYDPTYNSNAGAFVGIPTVVTVLQNTLCAGGTYLGEMSTTYDVSLHNSGATFASLEVLLSDENLTTLIPVTVRRPGMSVKFINSSTQSYEQYRYLSSSLSTASFVNMTNWIGLVSEPKVDDKNVITSGGVNAAISYDKPIGIYSTKKNYYINNTSHKHSAAQGYNICVFHCDVGGIYNLTIPKSGNALMVSYVFVSSASQSTDIPSSINVGDTTEQTFMNIVATTEWMQCTYDASGSAPTLIQKSGESWKERIHTIEGEIDKNSSEITAIDAFVRGNPVTKNIQFSVVGGKDVAYPMYAGKKYTIIVDGDFAVTVKYKVTESSSSVLIANSVTGRLIYKPEVDSEYLYLYSYIVGEIQVFICEGDYHPADSNQDNPELLVESVVDEVIVPTSTINNKYIAYSSHELTTLVNTKTLIYPVTQGRKYDIYIPAVSAIFQSFAFANSAAATSFDNNGVIGETVAHQYHDVVALDDYLFISYISSAEDAPIVNTTKRVSRAAAPLANLNQRVTSLEEDPTIANKPKLSVVSTYNAIAGENFELFYDGIFDGINPQNYEFFVKFSDNIFRGQHFTEKWQWTPAVADVGTYTLTIELYSDVALIDTKDITLVVTNAANLTSDNKVCLIVGDSILVSQGYAVAGEVYRRICSNDAESTADNVHYPAGFNHPNFQFIGVDQSTRQPNAWCVGVGGWTADFYNKESLRGDWQWLVCTHDKTDADQHSTYKDSQNRIWRIETIEAGRIKVYEIEGAYSTALLSGTLTWVSGGTNHSDIIITSASYAPGNPFWIGGKVDFAAFAEEQGVSTIDYVCIHLGGNDSTTPEEKIISDTETMINNILADFPSCKITLMTTHRSARDGWYGTNKTYYSFVKFCAKLKSIYVKIAADYNGKVVICDEAAQLDIQRCDTWSYLEYNNRWRGTTPNYRRVFLNNALHPNYAGSCMIADAIVRDIINRFA